MLKNYLKIAFRNLIGNKMLSLINILGLAVSITVCFFISIFILHELSYERFQENYDDLYRTIIKGEITGQPIEYAVSMVPLPTVLQSDYPEIEAVAGVYVSESKRLMSYGDKHFYESSFLRATEDFFRVFDYELLRGAKETVLSEPGTIVLSESLARKYFAEADPLGATIYLNETEAYTVSGIFRDIPSNSHLQISAVTSEAYTEDIPQNWGSFGAHNYLRLKPGSDPAEFSNKIRNLAMEKMGITKEQTGMEFLLYLEPVKDIHLYSDYSYNLGNTGDITYVYVFSVIALFILVLAYINFINLTTAQNLVRAREIGVRKISGADRKTLIWQFLLESVLVTMISTVLAIGLVEILQPLFNTLIGLRLGLDFISHWRYLLAGISFLVFMAAVAGYFPAVYISSLNPVAVIKGNIVGNRRSVSRNILVVFQFVISITLICCTGVIYKQLRHFQSKKLGFDKEHVLLLPLRSHDSREKALTLKSELQNIPGISSVSLCNNYPGSGACSGHGFFPEGHSEERPWLMKTMSVDADFIRTFDLTLLEGRGFNESSEAENRNILVNETLVNEVGWQDPVGKTLKDPFIQEDGEMLPITVVGVLADFHVNPLRDKIEPLVLYYYPQGVTHLGIRFEPGNALRTLEIVEKEWKDMHPGMPFDYMFLDERFNTIHLSERHLATTFMYFTVLAILIACLGLFGLASFATGRRIREIGVRKVMGATVSEIVLLLSRDFSGLVLLANLIAWPLAWFAMHRWLQNFAYRTELNVWNFLLAGIIALLIALVTISFQTFRAANANPVKALKYE